MGVCQILALLLSTATLSGLPLFCRWWSSTASEDTVTDQRLVVVNGCTNQDVWIASSANVPGARNIKIAPGQTHAYSIPLAGLKSTRFWPKMMCNEVGEQCKLGSSGGPGQDCPGNGCAPPVDSKFEATWGCVGSACPSGGDRIDWWDTSAVDGFTVPFKVQVDESCPLAKSPDCSMLQLASCPTAEDLGIAGNLDLHVRLPSTGEVVGCYSPCGKLTFANWQNKDGSHQPQDEAAAPYCCPTPPVSPAACRTGPVIQTTFVQLIHQKCSNVYGYAYDDRVGLQTCPAGTRYTWTVMCPAATSSAEPAVVF